MEIENNKLIYVMGVTNRWPQKTCGLSRGICGEATEYQEKIM
jgi:hypothetical protein